MQRCVELGREGVHRGEPVGGILLQRAVDDRGDAQRHVRPLLQQVRRRLVDVLHRDRDEVVAGERHLPGQQFVEDDAERVDVRVRVDGPAARLLRRDVVARSEHGARLRHPLLDVE